MRIFRYGAGAMGGCLGADLAPAPACSMPRDSSVTPRETALPGRWAQTRSQTP